MIPLLILAKGLLYAGVVLLVGGIFTRRELTPAHPARRILGVGGLLLLVGVFLTLLGTLAVVGFTAPADYLDYLTQTGAGRALTLLLIGGLLLLAAELGQWPRPLTAAAAALTLWGLAGVGHGATHGPTVRLLHVVHAGAMCIWVGGVLALLTLRGAGPQHAARFTPVATACVFALALTGTFATLEHAGTLWGVWNSSYGVTLMVKLGVVALALLAALLARRAFARALGIRPQLALELTLLVGVLAVTATLSETPPPTHESGQMNMEGH
ncbi:CopD family protein [Deinococcus sp. QL22]|uniref:CopD family protein n=1 Tax=Deinococcus sp. QL22 TaxID=2939437 RepID=UPI002017AF78|nr:CopD family protein [Deinococcus sp. QL22]UQN06036.1 CopD family protein [Deinococcus sp. QL22]